MYNNIKRKEMSAAEQKYFKKLGEKLRTLMREKKLRQLDVAAEAGIAPGTMSNYLDGKRKLNSYKLAKILKAMSLSKEEIASFSIEVFGEFEIED